MNKKVELSENSMLPAAPKKLFGREKELATLRSALTAHSAFYIFGPGGIGKTALVSKFLHEEFSSELNNIFYFNIPRDIEYTAFLNLIISKILQFQQESGPVSTEQTDEDKLDYFHELVQKRSGTIVFDNIHHLAEDSAKTFIENLLIRLFDVQVFFLSRSPLPLLKPGIPIPFEFELSGINQQSVEEQIQIHQLESHFKDEKEHLYQFTKGNPLLLQQVIAYVKRTKSASKALELSNQSFLEYLLSGLPESAKEILHALSLFPFSVPAQAFSLPNEANVLKQLLQFQIIILEDEEKYTLHDTLKDSIENYTKQNKFPARIDQCLDYLSSIINFSVNAITLQEAVSIVENLIENGLQTLVLQKLLKDIILISIENEFNIDYTKLYKKYVSHFGFDIQLATSLGIYHFEHRHTEESLAFYHEYIRHADDSVSSKTISDETAFFLSLSQFQIHITSLSDREIFEKSVSDYLLYLFINGRHEKALRLFSLLIDIALWHDGTLLKVTHLKDLYHQIVDKLDSIKSVSDKDFLIAILLTIIRRYDGKEAAHYFESQLSPNWVQAIKSKKDFVEITQSLWDYYRHTGQYVKEGSLLDISNENDISHYSRSQKIAFFASFFRITTQQGFFARGINGIDIFRSHFDKNDLQIELDITLLGQAFLYTAIGWLQPAKEIFDSFQSISLNKGKRIFRDIHILEYYITIGDAHNAMVTLRSTFKDLIGFPSKIYKAYAHYQLARILILKRILKKPTRHYYQTLESDELNARFLLLMRFVIVQHHYACKNYNSAKKELEPIEKVSRDKKNIFCLYLAKEWECKILFAEKKFEQLVSLFQEIQSLWKELGNEHIPHRIELFRAGLALQRGFTDLASEILYSGYEKAMVFGNQILRFEYLAALVQLKKSTIELEKEYQSLLLDRSQYYLDDLTIFLESLFKRKTDDTLLHTDIQSYDDGSTIHQYEKPAQKIVIDPEFRTVSVPDSAQKVDFSKHEKLFTCLSILADSYPNVLSKEQLFTGIWKIRYSPIIHNNNIHVAIQRLRQRLKIINLEEIIITTQDGYKLNSLYEYRYYHRIQKSGLNERQRDFLEHAELILSKEEYSQKYQVSLRTAHTDLQELATIKKIKKIKKGKMIYFQPEENIN